LFDDVFNNLFAVCIVVSFIFETDVLSMLSCKKIIYLSFACAIVTNSSICNSVFNIFFPFL